MKAEMKVPDEVVQLDKPRLAAGVFSLTGLVWVAWALVRIHGAGVVLGIVALGFLGMAFYAFIGLGKAPCPECGTMRSGLSMKDNGSLQCRGCGAYFHTRDGEVFATDEDAVEGVPAFATACPMRIDWPPGCCVCGEEVTRTVPVELELEEGAPVAKDMLTRVATLGTYKLVSERRFEVQIPVCERHGSGSASLEFRYDEEQLFIKFRSRAYAHAFAEANGPVFWDS